MIKYPPKQAMVAPASFLNHVPAEFHLLFSSSFFTAAVELPAMTIGIQCPTAKRVIRMTPVAIFS
ncbi:MAG: hypothetical protein HUN05_09100 [Desulfobacter sp.]|nr:MAG: hypothetical protein HUN05_09100 [Desulfobacter sp.]